MNDKITWATKISFGKYGPKGDSGPVTLLNLLITDKPYLKWCYENELHMKFEELAWLFDNIKQHELDAIIRGKK